MLGDSNGKQGQEVLKLAIINDHTQVALRVIDFLAKVKNESDDVQTLNKQKGAVDVLNY